MVWDTPLLLLDTELECDHTQVGRRGSLLGMGVAHLLRKLRDNRERALGVHSMHSLFAHVGIRKLSQ